jgi:hypothetical protein
LQKSGLSNVITIPIVEAACKEYGVPWERTRNFLIERFPVLFLYYFWAPVRGAKYSNFITESLSLTGFFEALKFAAVGFVGMGSI